MKDILTQLDNLKKIQPSELWKSRAKEDILAKISENSPQKQSLWAEFLYFTRFLSEFFQDFIMKPAGTMVLVVLLVLGGGILKVKADNSLPGDLLYSLKRGGEKMQVALIFNEERRAEARLKIIDERVQEINSVISKKENDQEERVRRALASFHKDFTSVKENLNSATGGSEEAMKIARDVEDKTNEFQFILNKAQNKTNKRVKDDINEVINDVSETNFKALEVLVNENGDDSIATDLAKKIDSKIMEASEKLQDSGISSEEALAKLDEAKEELANNNFVVALQKIKEINDTVYNNSTSTEDTLDKNGVVKGEATSTMCIVDISGNGTCDDFVGTSTDDIK